MCNISVLTGGMDAFCIPQNAEKRGEAILGGALNTEAWSWKDGNVAVEFIVASSGCIPVVQALADIERVTERAEAALWLDVKGTVDPSEFNRPSECNALGAHTGEEVGAHIANTRLLAVL